MNLRKNFFKGCIGVSNSYGPGETLSCDSINLAFVMGAQIQTE